MKNELAIVPINELIGQNLEAMELVRGKEYQTCLPIDISLRVPATITAEHDQFEQTMNTINSDFSVRSKYQTDAAKTVHGVHQPG